jgi:acetolactate synthase-1/2/3 large subunit
VTHVERIPDLVDKAVRTALTGRPGPVYLELPIDVMFGPLDDADIVLPTPPAMTTKPAPSPGAVDRILELLAAAERPAIIIGGGALFSPGCADELTTFAERTGIPLFCSIKALGVIPPDHPNNLGHAGMLGGAARAKQPPDVVVQIGARAGLSLGGRSGSVVPHDATLVQIDVDGAELGRVKTPEVAVVADTGEALRALNAGLGSRPVAAPQGWLDLLRTMRRRSAGMYDAIPDLTADGLIHPAAAVRAVVAALSPDTAIAYDGGETPAWFVPLARSAGPGLFMGNGYLGTLGVGPGYAVGMAVARPGHPVAVITGDGAAGFHLAEFDTMARHDLPITTIVFNNASWGISRHGQELVFGKKNTAVVDLAPSAYHTVAQGLGCRGVQITRVEDIGPAVRDAQESGVPTCINIMTDPEVMHRAIEQMVGYTEREDEIPIPYYENIPVRR